MLPRVDGRLATIHAPIGVQASGKTELSRLIAAATGAVHVDLDAIRRRVWPDCPPVWDPHSGRGLRVQAAFEAAVLGQLAAGRDVIVDRTNVDPRDLARLRVIAPHARLLIHDLTAVPLAACVARDAARPDATRVGADGIRALHERWLAPSGRLGALQGAP
ncbi:ATP-binding protein [Streptomyces sp. NPDC002092]